MTSEAAARFIVLVLDAIGNRHHEARLEPDVIKLVTLGEDTYQSLKSAGKDFSTCAMEAKVVVVQKILEASS